MIYTFNVIDPLHDGAVCEQFDVGEHTTFRSAVDSILGIVDQILSGYDIQVVSFVSLCTSGLPRYMRVSLVDSEKIPLVLEVRLTGSDILNDKQEEIK